jgi:hypothetical protein
MTSEGLHSKAEIAAELAVRDDRIKELDDVLGKLGYCSECMTTPVVTNVEEPFSDCECGTSEDYMKRPLQELQLQKEENRLLRESLEKIRVTIDLVRATDGDVDTTIDQIEDILDN